MYIAICKYWIWHCRLFRKTNTSLEKQEYRATQIKTILLLDIKWGWRKHTYFTFIEGKHYVGKCWAILSNPKYEIVLHFLLNWNIPCHASKAVLLCGTGTFHAITIIQECCWLAVSGDIPITRGATRLRNFVFFCSTWWWTHNWT